MRSSLAFALSLGACWRSPPPVTERVASRPMAMLQSLALTPDNYEAILGGLPDDTRAQTVAALLDLGPVRCTRRAPDCAAGSVIAAPDPHATIDDPCFRRALALWAARRVGDDPDLELVPALRPFVGSAKGDEELSRVALQAVADAAPEQLLAFMIDAVHHGHQVDRDLVAKLSDADRRTAELQAHVFAAEPHFAQRDPIADRDNLLAAANDDDLDDDDRDTALLRLEPDGAGRLPRAVELALIETSQAKHCHTAAFAALVLDRHGVPTPRDARPITHDVAANMRSLCLATSGILAHSQTEAGFTPPTGMHVHWILRHRDGSASTTEEAIVPGQSFFPNADPTWMGLFDGCGSSHCTRGEQTIDLAFAPATDGGLWITDVTFTTIDDACG